MAGCLETHLVIFDDFHHKNMNKSPSGLCHPWLGQSHTQLLICKHNSSSSKKTLKSGTTCFLGYIIHTNIIFSTKPCWRCKRQFYTLNLLKIWWATKHAPNFCATTHAILPRVRFLKPSHANSQHLGNWTISRFGTINFGTYVHQNPLLKLRKNLENESYIISFKIKL
jgi:hypothetical protein